MPFESVQPITAPASSFTVLPQPISSVATTAPGRSIGERLARLIDVVPLEPTENGKNLDSLTLMMSSNRSVARLGVVDDGVVGVLPPQAVQSAARMGRRDTNRMISCRSYLTRMGRVRLGHPPTLPPPPPPPPPPPRLFSH